MDAKAIYRYARIAPRKVRLVADLVRGLPVSRALEVLAFTHKAASSILTKLINSAVANAGQKEDVDVDRLVIAQIYVDQGPMLKRFLPRAMGRATKIQKKTSHITVVVAEDVDRPDLSDLLQHIEGVVDRRE